MKDTGQRLLDAATRVFARQGISGATTREIAAVAKVNEVTLFRYFKNKDELLRRVVAQKSKRFEHVFAEASFETPADLRRTVQSYATAYVKMLRENEELVRTFLGEMTRRLPLCRRLFVESSQPIRQRLIHYLRGAKKRGLLRANVDVATAADALSGMLMAGTLRRPLTDPEYTQDRYVKTCLDLFLKGLEP